MFIDISVNAQSANLILYLDGKERYLTLQDNSPVYNLCHVKSGDKHFLPYITLPLLTDICKRVNYSLKLSDALKEYHRGQILIRNNLELLKEGKSPENWPEFQRIHAFLESLERDRGFTLLEGQRRSIPYCIYGKTILIGNEIGTGKTLIANIVGKYLIATGRGNKILLLVPASLVSNFQDDYHRFFGKSGLMVIGKESPEKRRVLYNQFMQSSCNFLLTNYEKCLHDYEYLKRCKFDMIVVDEFHRMRNFFSAKRSINFFDMVENIWRPEYRFPMSGTPIENKLFDLFPIFKLMDGGKVLGGQRFFENNFVEYEDTYFKVKYQGRMITKSERKAAGFKNLEWVKRLIKPRIIREKLKLNVKYFHEFVFMEMSKETKEKYNELRKEHELASSRYHALRQFLCDPTRKELSDCPKTEMLLDIIDQTSEKIVIFSFYICSMEYLESVLKRHGIKHYEISGRTSEVATETIKKFSDDPDAKVLICTDKVNFGCNVQCAKLTINWDIPLKPTTADQRKGRLYRTGQTQDVYGKTFIVKDSVEEIIYKAYLLKQEVISAALADFDQEKLERLEAEIEREVLAKI